LAFRVAAQYTIHAINDAQGRPLTFVLAGSEAHSCPIGAGLIENTIPGELMLADEA
jgi:transposase